MSPWNNEPPAALDRFDRGVTPVAVLDLPAESSRWCWWLRVCAATSVLKRASTVTPWRPRR